MQANKASTTRFAGDSRGAKPIKISLELSTEASDNLEQLRLLSLDSKGNKPSASAVVEELLRAALKDKGMFGLT